VLNCILCSKNSKMVKCCVLGLSFKTVLVALCLMDIFKTG
jgi:hypothetical protein